MNPWAKKTVTLAKTEDYLDRLYAVYPNDSETRIVDADVLASIEKSFNRREGASLLEQLLNLDKFPMKDSYVSFLRIDRSAMKRNPKTVKRICDTLYNMGFDKVKEGIIEPKEANTRRGQQFRNWAMVNFKHVELDKFINSTRGVIFLEGSEKEVLDFCNVKLKLGLMKRPDFVAKSKEKYVVGEAKFLSSTGGNQGRGFKDAIDLASKASGTAYKVAVIDGVLWIQNGSQEFNSIKTSTVCALSALLLNDYCKSL